MNKTLLDILENLPYEVYGNKYYKGRHYNREVDYYQWNYDIHSKYFDYQINLYEYKDTLEIYTYENDVFTRKVPKTVLNTLNNMIAYFAVLGFTIRGAYEK